MEAAEIISGLADNFTSGMDLKCTESETSNVDFMHVMLKTRKETSRQAMLRKRIGALSCTKSDITWKKLRYDMPKVAKADLEQVMDLGSGKDPNCKGFDAIGKKPSCARNCKSGKKLECTQFGIGTAASRRANKRIGIIASICTRSSTARAAPVRVKLLVGGAGLKLTYSGVNVKTSKRATPNIRSNDLNCVDDRRESERPECKRSRADKERSGCDKDLDDVLGPRCTKSIAAGTMPDHAITLVGNTKSSDVDSSMAKARSKHTEECTDRSASMCA